MSDRNFPLWAQALTGVLLISGLFFGTTACDASKPLGDRPETPVRPATPPPQNPDIPPTPGTVSVVSYTRIICRPTLLGSSPYLETLLTSGTSRTAPAVLSMQDENNHEIDFIDRLQIISGNEEAFEFTYSQVRKNDKKVDLYLGKMDLRSHKAVLKKISTAPLIERAFGRALEAPGIANFIAISRISSSLLVPDILNDRYILRNSFSTQVLSNIFLSPKVYINPVLSSDADLALFQRFENSQLRNYAYSMISDQAIPFPKGPETLQQYSPHIFRSGQIAWLEETTSGLQLKITSWNDLQAKKITLLAEISTKDLVAIDFGAKSGSLYLAKALETYRDSGTSRRLNRGFLEITEWNLANLEDTNMVVVEYPVDFYLRKMNVAEVAVERILFSPWNNQWVFTTPKGIAIFSQVSKIWNFVGPQNGSSRCFHPSIGPEYHVEEVH